MARTSICKKTTSFNEENPSTSSVTFTFISGEPLSASLSQFTPSIVTQLALHGLSQKVGDSYSGESDVAAARFSANKVLENLIAGNFGATRGEGKIGDLAQALMNLTGKSKEEVLEALDSMSKEDKLALRRDARVKKELLTIQLSTLEAGEEEASPLLF